MEVDARQSWILCRSLGQAPTAFRSVMLKANAFNKLQLLVVRAGSKITEHVSHELCPSSSWQVKCEPLGDVLLITPVLEKMERVNDGQL